MEGSMEWWIATDYAAQHGFLVALGPPVRSYRPTESETVLARFGKIGWGDDEAVTAFARQYGHLGGLWEYRDPMESKSRTLSSMLTASEVKDGAFVLPPAKEPLRAIWKEAATIQTCLRLIEYAQGHAREGLADYLRSMAHPADRPGLAVEIAPGRVVVSEVDLDGEDWPMQAATDIILQVVNKGLADSPTATPFRMSLESADGGRFRIGYSFQSLLQVIYWHLARVAAGEGGRSVARCEECGQFFVKTHGKQRFCPPPGGEDGQSLCGLKVRQRRLRSKTEKGGTQP
jgi:hypothetical protein